MTREGISTVVPHLEREQANATRLYLQYKGYHWNVSGPLFHDLHLLFDEHAKIVLESVDELAERQRILGAAAGYTLEETKRVSTLPLERALPESPRAMVDRLLESHRLILRGMHDGFKAAEREGDPGCADLFARLIQAHQKMEWFLRELLPGRSAILEERPELTTPSAEKAPGEHVVPNLRVSA